MPSRVELERYFFLNDADRLLVEKRRGEHNRLGFAVQLGTVRMLGTFLSDPLDVPWPVVDYLAVQLGVADASVVKRYAERLPTQHEHAREIRDVYGFREFSDVRASGQLREFLDGRAWTHAEGPLRLFEQAAPSLRWADPARRPRLDGVRREVLAGLVLDEPVEVHLAGLTTALDAAWRLLAQRMEEAGPDAGVRIVPAGADGRVKLAVDRLDAVREPASLTELRTAVADMLPRVDLSEWPLR